MKAESTNDKGTLKDREIIALNLNAFRALAIRMENDERVLAALKKAQVAYEHVSPNPDSVKIDGKIADLLEEIEIKFAQAKKKRIFFKNMTKENFFNEIEGLLIDLRALVEQR